MIINATEGIPPVEISTLLGGDVFKWNGCFWIKTTTFSGGYHKAVNLTNGETDGFLPHAKIIPMRRATLTDVTY